MHDPFTRIIIAYASLWLYALRAFYDLTAENVLADDYDLTGENVLADNYDLTAINY